MRSFLPKSVRSKILILAILPILALVTLAAGIYAMDVKSEADQIVLERFKLAQSAATRLQRDVTELSRIGYAFQNTPEQSEVDGFGGTLAGAVSEAKKMRQNIMAPDLLAELQTLQIVIEKFKTNFDMLVTAKIALGSSVAEGTNKALADAVTTLTDTLESNYSNTTIQPSIGVMSETLSAMNSYRIDPTKPNLDIVAGKLVALSRAVDGAVLSDAIRAKIKEQHDTLSVAFNSWAAADQTVRLQLAALDQLYTDAIQHTEILASRSKANAETHSMAVASLSNWHDRLVMGAISGIVVILLSLGLIISRSITRPLAALGSAMMQLGKGDTEVEISGTTDQSELGNMAGAVLFFRDAMREREQLTSSELENRLASEERRKSVERLIGSFRMESASDLVAVAAINEQLGSTATGLGLIAVDASSKASSAASAAEDASSTVAHVAAAANQLSLSIETISHQVVRTSEMVSHATSIADSANSRIEALSKAAQEIGDVVSLIQKIAGQTNLLALNATIEAARAGDVGRGFAVVAQEVKALSGQTSQATAEISHRIAAVQGSTLEAVSAISEIATLMREVSIFATSIASAVHEQEAATAEISRGVARAADRANTVLADINDVNSASAGTTKVATDVAAASQSAGQKSRELTERIETFLQHVAAA